MNFVTGEVIFAAIIDPVRCLPSDPAYYVVFLTNEEWFASITRLGCMTPTANHSPRRRSRLDRSSPWPLMPSVASRQSRSSLWPMTATAHAGLEGAFIGGSSWHPRSFSTGGYTSFLVVVRSSPLCRFDAAEHQDIRSDSGHR